MPCAVERDARERRPRDAAQAVFAAGHFRPAKRHRIQHRRQRQRQQRKIDTAPAQNQEAEHERDNDHERQADQRRQHERARRKSALRHSDCVRREAEPRAVPERREPGVTHQDVQRHARQREDHDFGGRRDAQPDDAEHKRQQHERERGKNQVAGDRHFSCSTALRATRDT